MSKTLVTMPTADVSEKAMAGACCFAPRVVDSFSDITKAMFANETLGAIVEAVRDLREAGNPIDNQIVIAELTRRGIDLKGIIEEIFDCGTADAAHVEYHAQRIRDAHVRRSIIFAAQAAILDAQNPLAESGQTSETLIAKLQSHTAEQGKHTATATEVADRLYESTFNPSAATPRAVKTEIAIVDNHIGGGFYPGQSIILSAATGNGKTTAALNIAENAAMAGRTVMFVCFEMDDEELGERIVARHSGLTIDEQRGRLSDEQASLVKQGLTHVAGLSDRLIFHTPPSATVGSIWAEARMINARGNLDLIVIDYMQLIDPEGRHQNTNSEVSQISRSIKKMAVDLKVPVLTLSQLNREGSRQVPELRHLRDSGSIEQDANTVFFLHDAGEANSRQFIIAKNRNGPKKALKLSYDAPRFLFEDPNAGIAGEGEW